jgi:hypothetical protein
MARIPRAGNEFLELSFNHGVANVLILQHTVRIDCKCMGNRRHTEHFRNQPGKASVANSQSGHFILRNELFRLVGIQTYAQNH